MPDDSIQLAHLRQVLAEIADILHPSNPEHDIRVRQRAHAAALFALYPETEKQARALAHASHYSVDYAAELLSTGVYVEDQGWITDPHGNRITPINSDPSIS